MFEIAVAMSLLEMAATTGIFLWTVWPEGGRHGNSMSL